MPSGFGVKYMNSQESFLWELTKTKAVVGTCTSATKTGWEKHYEKRSEDSPPNEMRWHENENFCRNPQEAWS